MSSPKSSSAPLDGFVVIDLSTGIAGAYCTKLLADGGARVIKVESPEGDPLRSWSASGADIPPGDDGALFNFLTSSKHSVVADADSDDDLAFVSRLLDSADAVVWSSGSPIAEHPSFEPVNIRRSHEHLIVTAVTAFGLEGPWSKRPATEFTVQAWSGGMIGLGRGAQDRAPVFVGGQVGEWLAGAFAAAGTLTSHYRAPVGDGRGELVDVSMLEVEILCLTYYSVSFTDALGRPFRDLRRVSLTGVVAAKDGLVALGLGTAQQWFDMCAMVGHPEWIDASGPLSITEQAKLRAPIMREWFHDHTVDEIRELASAYRIPNSPVGDGARIDAFDHFQERKSIVVNPGGGFRQPGPPYRMSPSLLTNPLPAPRLGEHTHWYRQRSQAESPAPTVGDTRTSLPFSGLRVLDLTTFWAGPSCTHFLALLGADVIHVESAARPDGTRLSADIPMAEPQWWDKSPIFSGLNTNKRSLTVDTRHEKGRELLRRLAKTCDVIVENYTPRVLDVIGLNWPALQQLRPDAILLRMPGFGLDGPWRDIPALASVIEGASGLTWLTGHPDQEPVEPYTVGDSNAGVHALVGLLLALEHRRRTGEGVFVEAPMVDAALNVAAEQVIEFSAYGAVLSRAGNCGPAAAPQNLYQTNEIDEFGRADCWVAIAVATDEHWKALRTGLGEPEWATDPELDVVAGRRNKHTVIDRHLADWCSSRTADEIVECLWEAGVPVGKVMWPHHVGEIPQLDTRRFYEKVTHPVGGTARHSTVPMRLSEGPETFHVRHAPMLGQHTRELLAELGLSAAEIAELEAEGVTDSEPKF